MKELLTRLLMVPLFIRGDIIAIRVGEGVGITVYTGKTGTKNLQEVAAKFFQLAYKLKNEKKEN